MYDELRRRIADARDDVDDGCLVELFGDIDIALSAADERETSLQYLLLRANVNLARMSTIFSGKSVSPPHNRSFYTISNEPTRDQAKGDTWPNCGRANPGTVAGGCIE